MHPSLRQDREKQHGKKYEKVCIQWREGTLMMKSTLKIESCSYKLIEI